MFANQEEGENRGGNPFLTHKSQNDRSEKWNILR